MKLIIGGYSQGKLNYVLKNSEFGNYVICDGQLTDCIDANDKTIIINHFHNWVKKSIINDGCPEKEVIEFVNKQPHCIIISDEIGNGIVPIDSFEREYRERTGRILIELAGMAEEVVRVICGIGQKIK